MKKITLLVATVLLVGNVVNATEVNTLSEERRTRYSFDEPISFVERGIEFFVFPNGDFDFNTRPQDSQGGYFYKTAGRRGTVATTSRSMFDFGVRIEHDSFGRVRRVGNTFINYDSRDRVSRIGSVYMRYNRFALTQIGGLQIIYNRRGDIVDMIGSIKGYRNQGYVYYYNQNVYSYQANNDDDYYYYKEDGTKALIEEKK